jgi:hypothetical protein
VIDVGRIIKFKVIDKFGVRTEILVDLDTILHLLRIDTNRYDPRRSIYDQPLLPISKVKQLSKDDKADKLRLFGYTDEDIEKILAELEKEGL